MIEICRDIDVPLAILIQKRNTERINFLLVEIDVLEPHIIVCSSVNMPSDPVEITVAIHIQGCKINNFIFEETKKTPDKRYRIHNNPEHIARDNAGSQS